MSDDLRRLNIRNYVKCPKCGAFHLNSRPCADCNPIEWGACNPIEWGTQWNQDKWMKDRPLGERVTPEWMGWRQREAWQQGAEFGFEAALRVQQHEQSLASIEHDLDEDDRIEALAWKRLLDLAGVDGREPTCIWCGDGADASGRYGPECHDCNTGGTVFVSPFLTLPGHDD